MVEFALVLPLLLVILLAVLDFGRAFYYWNNTTHLAAEGARLASVDRDISALPDAGTATDLCQYLKNKATSDLHMPSDTTVSYTPAAAGDALSVHVSYTFSFLPFLQLHGAPGSKALDSTSDMRMETTPVNNASGCTA
jgi:Flp pilus assembly protein TadG